jgi:hypothetical protein
MGGTGPTRVLNLSEECLARTVQADGRVVDRDGESCCGLLHGNAIQVDHLKELRVLIADQRKETSKAPAEFGVFGMGWNKFLPFLRVDSLSTFPSLLFAIPIHMSISEHAVKPGDRGLVVAQGDTAF